MTDVVLALTRVIDQAVQLDVHTRVALIKDWPTANQPHLQPLTNTLPALLAFPDPDETETLKAALVGGIREMRRAARLAFVDVVFSAQLNAGAAQGLFDAVAALVSVIDKELTR
jgi:hypothetical protein